MTHSFPSCRTEEEFKQIRRDEGRLEPVVEAILDTLGLSGERRERFPDGSLPVYAIGDSSVLKIYPPLYAQECEREAAVLEATRGRLSIPTPGVQAKGVVADWAYLLMDRLRGQSLAEAWPRIAHGERLLLATRLGEALAALHSLPVPAHASLHVDWPAFLSQQRRTAVERQRRKGLAEPWLAQIDAFLDQTPLAFAGSTSLLHTEIMREHLLVERGPGGWQLTGLLDFEPAMAGAREYEFVSVGLFFSCGHAELLRRVLLAYGYRNADLGQALQRKLLAYMLLHRYSNLPWYLSRLPAGHGVSTLDELSRVWWGTDL